MKKDCVEWRDIKGFEGWYQVNQLGQVRGLDRIVGNKVKRRIKGVLLKPRVDRNGYPVIILLKNGKRKSIMIHRQCFAQSFNKAPGQCVSS